MSAPYWQSLSKRKSRNTTAYRYRYGRGRAELQSLQIPGPIDEPLTQARAAEVRRWIAAGSSPESIILLIRRWQQNRP